MVGANLAIRTVIKELKNLFVSKVVWHMARLGCIVQGDRFPTLRVFSCIMFHHDAAVFFTKKEFIDY